MNHVLVCAIIHVVQGLTALVCVIRELRKVVAIVVPELVKQTELVPGEIVMIKEFGENLVLAVRNTHVKQIMTE